MISEGSTMRFLPLMIFQLLLMVLYFVFVRYDGTLTENVVGFEDTHVMIFIGFGFLMTFLKKYCYSALGINWLLAALVVQWAILCQQAYSMQDYTIFITKKAILEADIMSATVLITFGALLGVASTMQLLFVGIIEIAVACFNLYLVADVFKVSDVGGSIAIHAFGAYFGLGASWAMRPKKVVNKDEASVPVLDLNGPTYSSDITAMIGSIFLFIYWPSFNSALASSPAEYQRAVVNTYLSLAAAVVTTFVLSAVVSKHKGKFDMVHVQNSTLAGGVAVGTVCNMHIGAGGAIAIGICAGALSVLGYRFLTPNLEKIGIMDTCGVNNLHGMPGLFSGLLSVVMAALATSEGYQDELFNIFGAMKDGRTAQMQAVYQLVAVAVTFIIAFGSGAISGFIAKTRLFTPLKETERYNDEVNWELP